MNKSHYLAVAHNILSEIFLQKAFANIAINRNVSDATENKDLVIRIVYGVTERSVEFDEIISRFAHSLKPAIVILLKIVAYCHLYLDSLPPYALVNSATEFSKSMFLGNYTALVNACSRKITAMEKKVSREREVTLTAELRTKLTAQYGVETIEAMEETAVTEYGHIRPNTKRFTLTELKAKLTDKGIEFTQSGSLGLFVRSNETIREMFNKGDITYQSPSSMLAVQCLGARRNQQILDLCSAPGGKAIYVTELAPNAEITACDIHPHRLNLIKSYAERMNARNIKTMELDATVENEEFIGKYDCVMCDVPCTGTGMVFNKPDMLIGGSRLDGLDELVTMQKSILEQAKKYIKPNGCILYSTCSVLEEENNAIVDDFLSKNHDFTLVKLPISSADFKTASEGYVQLLPSKMWDGFFIAKLAKRG